MSSELSKALQNLQNDSITLNLNEIIKDMYDFVTCPKSPDFKHELEYTYETIGDDIVDIDRCKYCKKDWSEIDV